MGYILKLRRLRKRLVAQRKRNSDTGNRTPAIAWEAITPYPTYIWLDRVWDRQREWADVYLS